MKSPIKSGWKGDINGFIESTNSYIQVNQITLKLDTKTAWALCNLLLEKQIEKSHDLEKSQKPGLISLGAALGRLIDHPSSNNGNRKVIK